MLSKFRNAVKAKNIIRPLQQACNKKHLSTQTIIEKEDKYAAHNYHPLPVALCKGEGYY